MLSSSCMAISCVMPFWLSLCCTLCCVAGAVNAPGG